MSGSNELEQFCMHCGHKIAYLSHQAGSNVFCPQCGQSVQIQADASNPVKAEPSQVAATSSDIMPPADVHLSIEGQQYGPYTEAEIQGHLKTGQVAPTTLARREGMSGWLPLNELLQPALEPAVAQPVATNPQATIVTSADPQPEVPVSADIDDEAFKCIECGKAFKYQGSLENHQKRKRHGNYQQLPADSIEDDEIEDEVYSDEGELQDSENAIPEYRQGWAIALYLCFIFIPPPIYFELVVRQGDGEEAHKSLNTYYHKKWNFLLWSCQFHTRKTKGGVLQDYHACSVQAKFLGITYAHSVLDDYVLMSRPFGTRETLKYTGGGKDASGDPSDHFGFFEQWGYLIFVIVVFFTGDKITVFIDNLLKGRNSESTVDT